jgi:hypothetical protein
MSGFLILYNFHRVTSSKHIVKSRFQPILRGLAVLCVVLTLSVSFAQIGHVHKDFKGRTDCSSCALGHSTVAASAFIAELPTPVAEPIEANATSRFIPDNHVRVFTIRPPPVA